MSKGSRTRPYNREKFSENFDKVFGKRQPVATGRYRLVEGELVPVESGNVRPMGELRSLKMACFDPNDQQEMLQQYHRAGVNASFDKDTCELVIKRGKSSLGLLGQQKIAARINGLEVG